MSEPTKAQIKEFWEWCGYTGKLAGIEAIGEREGKLVYISPPIDLNNLFKYAVPKLQDKGHCVTIQSYEQKGYLAFVSETVFSQRGSDGYDPFYQRISEYEAEDPALALFWALWQVKGKKNKRELYDPNGGHDTRHSSLGR